MKNKELRNIAIVAHVDHGKTTLVDGLLKSSGLFRADEVLPDQVMDSDAIERERGITILAKNTAIDYGNIRINIVDTPGHADFSGEVERVLKMVDGVLLLVDAFDGPMPQTRFVLAKALAMNLKTIVIINKIDRPDARPQEVADMILELYMDLGASDEQIEFPILYASAKKAASFRELPESLDEASLKEADMRPILDTIVSTIPDARGDDQAPLQMLVSNIDYDNYLGRLATGRIQRGTLKAGDQVSLISSADGEVHTEKITKVFVFQGLGRQPVESAGSGEIVCLGGIEEVQIGDTICQPDHLEALDFVEIEEPTIAMVFQVNDSPFAGREGNYVTSRHLRDRLEKEMLRNVAMRLEYTDREDSFIVKGRGELHISILIENMRREGYEFQVSRPYIINKEIDGVLMEPQELLSVTVAEEYAGAVIEGLGRRKAEILAMHPPFKSSVRLEFRVPSRQLIGYRSQFMNDTRGNGLMSSVLDGYIPVKGESVGRNHGVIVAFENGEATQYGLHNAQDRGELFIGPGTPVYEGMIIGTTMQTEDVQVNVCKKKQLTNMRAAGSDDALRLSPPIDLSLEQSMEFISDEEMIELTPTSIRLRKKILDTKQRLKDSSKK
ncbi:MAG: translational GTPase TypA [Eubacteriales bacterium]|nr:translational GTPase TypA [Clostridiales bacterium]MDY5836919.1 translational GTPase TypA [Eubacteriales bacterium]